MLDYKLYNTLLYADLIALLESFSIMLQLTAQTLTIRRKFVQ